MRTYKIAALGGDGIGPEVVAAGIQALKVCAERDGGFTLDFQDFDWGSDYYKKHGAMMPADGADQLRAFDAILFGAVGAPDIPDHVTLWGLRLSICQPLDQYANVRPTRILLGIMSSLRHVSGPELDWVIVRENTEGEYSGVGGRVHKGLPIEVAEDVSVMTRPGVQRILRYGFELARSRPRKRLTVVTKSNAQRHAMVTDGAVDVRAHPRLGIRHHGQGHRQPGRDVLDGGNDARAFGREACRKPVDAGCRRCHSPAGSPHTGPGRQSHYPAGHRCRVRGAAPGQGLVNCNPRWQVP
jgi:hypothetical protein